MRNIVRKKWLFFRTAKSEVQKLISDWEKSETDNEAVPGV
jgi:hypothetical protein